jgi:hypothetical protein
MPEKGRLVYEGMGGFLNPPTHPEHNWSVETDLRRRPENRGRMSLSAAVESKWLEPAAKASAQRKLESWKRPALESVKVQDWIIQVLGYFRDCYYNPEHGAEGWHAGKVMIDHERDPMAWVDHHAGVRLIRKYYPEFVPEREHFKQAYWGTKPGVTA